VSETKKFNRFMSALSSYIQMIFPARDITM
jgi:hypothetical protein